MVAESSTHSIGRRLDAIRTSVHDFHSIIAGMSRVKMNVQEMDTNIAQVLPESQASANELLRISERMRILEQHVTAISGLVQTVNGIADKTHLLALNASIEAARAGDAGKGFSVVAGEVKELATTTRNANQEINETRDRISATDARGKITFANNVFYQISEYEPGELVGRPTTRFVTLICQKQLSPTCGHKSRQATSGRGMSPFDQNVDDVIG